MKQVKVWKKFERDSIGTVVARRTSDTTTSSTADSSEQAGPSQAPPSKWQKLSVFASYKSVLPSRQSQPSACNPELIVTSYIDAVSKSTSFVDMQKYYGTAYEAMIPVLERIFCVPATSAPVERIFSRSGIIMRPHRNRLTDATLRNLMLNKCNIFV